LRRNESSNIFLSFLCATSYMRRQYHVRKTSKFTFKRILIAFWLNREYVDTTTRNCLVFYCLLQSGNVYHMASAKVKENSTWLHKSKFFLPNNVVVFFTAIYMKCYHIYCAQKLFHREAFGGIS